MPCRSTLGSVKSRDGRVSSSRTANRRYDSVKRAHGSRWIQIGRSGPCMGTRAGTSTRSRKCDLHRRCPVNIAVSFRCPFAEARRGGGERFPSARRGYRAHFGSSKTPDPVRPARNSHIFSFSLNVRFCGRAHRVTAAAASERTGKKKRTNRYQTLGKPRSRARAATS